MMKFIHDCLTKLRTKIKSFLSSEIKNEEIHLHLYKVSDIADKKEHVDSALKEMIEESKNLAIEEMRHVRPSSPNAKYCYSHHPLLKVKNSSGHYVYVKTLDSDGKICLKHTVGRDRAEYKKQLYEFLGEEGLTWNEVVERGLMTTKSLSAPNKQSVCTSDEKNIFVNQNITINTNNGHVQQIGCLH